MDEENNEKKCYPVSVNYLPEIFNQKAVRELNETPETRRVEIQKLLELLSNEKSTADIKFETDFLQAFLRHSKYNSSKAFRYLQKYIKFRRNYSSLFQSIPEDRFNFFPSNKFISVLPYRCPDGCAIVLSELGKWDPNEISIEDLKRLCLASFLQPLRNPMTQISGFKMIHDCKDTAKHIKYCTPHNLSLIYSSAFKCVPARYKEIHCINKSIVMTASWSVFKHIMSEKMKNRVYFHSKPRDLLNHFPSSIIPTQYGGSLDDYHDGDLMKQINKEYGSCPAGGQSNYY